MSAAQPDMSEAVYRNIARHNRAIAALRIAVPVAGLILFSVPLIQFALGVVGETIVVDGAALDADTLVIQSPRFEGLTADGAVYRMEAARSESDTGNLDVSTLYDLTIDLDGAAGYWAEVTFSRAEWTMSREYLSSDETVYVEDSTGAQGVLEGAEADWPAQIIKSDGPVRFTYANGSELNANTMVHDIAAATWHFTGPKVEMQPVADAGTPRTGEVTENE
ncbi:hypothetical protein [Pelagibacterium xiamenense]|uniref:hypothetical protein n=1 Tax=Pelagibacterium xiamenense TaxID=2901140 RepID=UPI001E340232|nr:hypothetical protein [Pelagibacterium xiamenense]MCD7058541.1 hypothetical protein [Pelagibacterium xiamenense]